MQVQVQKEIILRLRVGKKVWHPGLESVVASPFGHAPASLIDQDRWRICNDHDSALLCGRFSVIPYDEMNSDRIRRRADLDGVGEVVHIGIVEEEFDDRLTIQTILFQPRLLLNEIKLSFGDRDIPLHDGILALYRFDDRLDRFFRRGQPLLLFLDRLLCLAGTRRSHL